MTTEEIQLQSFQIIAGVGCARSCYIDAIHLARDGKFEEAEAKIAEGQQHYAEGHAAHGGLVQQTAAGEDLSIDLLVVHAEDQLMSAEGFGILAKEFVDVYRKMARSRWPCCRAVAAGGALAAMDGIGSVYILVWTERVLWGPLFCSPCMFRTFTYRLG